VIWYHDESTFYANDRRKTYWVHKDEKAIPQPKGEGASLMVADFVSADYGWLRSPDGTESARVLFRAGKARQGYFTNAEILEHAVKAMSILEKHFPNEDHVLIFDNATTHMKRADNSLSARKLSKLPTKEGNPLFGVETVKLSNEGKPLYRPNGKIEKEKVRMTDAKFKDGSLQSLYFPEGHARAGVFKGMLNILEERGFTGMQSLRAKCKEFKSLATWPDIVANNTLTIC
jgi:hypothetical protein